MVTGAVVHRGNLHIGAELAVLGREAQALALGKELLVEGHGHVGACGGEEIGAAAVAAVAVEGELADHQNASAHVGKPLIHFIVFVAENAKPQHLFRELAAKGGGVVLGDAQENEKALADLARRSWPSMATEPSGHG